ncbi:MAG TPA: hypothetical protein VFS22_05050 [Flavisolibacter sp.]|nr:hypothetical protein [Flavisolibacter sp.]
MSTIKGYTVRMWTSDKDIHNEKFFSSENLLEARRQAFAYADNLVEIMDEAKQAGVIHYNNPEEILNPSVTIEDVVIGSVHVSVVYDETKDNITVLDEDIIYMPVANEGRTVEVPIDENKIMQVTSIETIDLTDEETIRIHNKEAEHYIKTGGHQGIVFLTIDQRELFLLMDDFVRLKNKNLIIVEEGKDLKQAV